MSKKFRVNETVVVKATGEKGVVKAREVLPDSGKRIKVQYIVKLGDGIENWKPFNRSELATTVKPIKENRGKMKVYEMGDGYKLTLLAKTKVVSEKLNLFGADEDDDLEPVTFKAKNLSIGYSIYNPNDEYDEEIGYKRANNRLKFSPFCCIASSFTGEFDAATVEAIMDVKAKYIIANKERFITYPDK